jgi:hypothetical protein
MTKAVSRTDPAPAGTPALKLTGITKTFGSVTPGRTSRWRSPATR